jgi:ketosteroid isomerase-like protein
MATALEIGSQIVALCNAGKGMEAIRTLYSPEIVSCEGPGSPPEMARVQGLDAVIQKGEWWEANHEVHRMVASGPFCGHRDDQFVVEFEMEITPKHSGERTQMREVGLYTVRDGKIVQEEFMYLMG